MQQKNGLKIPLHNPQCLKNTQKNLILQHCERSELHFKGTDPTKRGEFFVPIKRGEFFVPIKRGEF